MVYDNYDFRNKLGFGLMRLPQKNRINSKDIDLELFKKMVDIFMDNGLSYFDTAYMYHGGMSEVFFREAVVKRYDRNKFTITDKLPVFLIDDENQVQDIFEEQLTRCGVDYFDYYWLHALSAEKYETSKKIKAFEFIQKMKEIGKVKHIGFSFHDTAEVLDTILKEHPEMEYVQLQLNYLDWEDENVQSRKCYEVARKYDIPIIAMEPIKGGRLAVIPDDANKLFKELNSKYSTASWAMRYVGSLDGVVLVLSGMSNEDHVIDNISSMINFKSLNKNELSIIRDVRTIIKNKYSILCTSCHYCTDDCPKHISIPELFDLYNEYERLKDINNLDKYKKNYLNITKNGGKASDCIECRTCEKYCPQHLSVVDLLKDIAKIFE